MDKVDVRIVRACLQGEPLFSIWPARANSKPALGALSKKLGMAETTVRARYKKLSSFLRGWTLFVNPNLMHMKMGALCWLDVPEEVPKQNVLEKLKLIDDMMIIVNYSNRAMACIMMNDDGTDVNKKIDLIRRIAESREGVYSEIPFPSLSGELSVTDLRIIHCLQEDMAKSCIEVADELEISSRTVRRRLARLVREGSIWPVASLNVGALKDVVYADLLVIYDPDSRAKMEAEILSMVDDYLIFNGHFASLTEFNLMLPSVPMARIVLNRVNRLSGVRRARIDFVEERFEFYEIIGERVKLMLSRIAKGSLRSPTSYGSHLWQK